MTEKAPSKLKPTTLRLLLVVALFVVATLATVGFIFIQQKLGDYAMEVSRKKVDATASETSLQTLQSIQKQLAEDGETIIKAENIKHASSLPQFKAIEDIQNHAKANNINLGNVSFADAGAAATPGTAAPAAGATPATPAAPVTTRSGIDISFSVNDGEVPIASFVRFLYDIEHSTPKMQIKGIALSKGDSKDSITVGEMTVTMFTK
jgi:hypothetical protein